MKNKQIASLLFNKNRTDNDQITTEIQSDLEQPSTEIVTTTQDLLSKTSDSFSNTAASFLPDSYQKAIQRAKEVLSISKDLFSKLYK